VAGLNADVVDYPLDEWKRVFDVNINGLFYCNRYVGLLMKARGYGRIVNISSVAGKEGNPRASAYSASKAAVIGFTKSFGKELAKDGVIVNAVAPAVIETPMLGKVDAAHVAYMRSKIPMERFGTVDEVALSSVGSRAANAHSARARCSTSQVAAPPTDGVSFASGMRLASFSLRSTDGSPKDLTPLI
jgi:NAD(P)-dependent dehydrogenase (short-subunit alcohol dehydrogenase family)